MSAKDVGAVMVKNPKIAAVLSFVVCGAGQIYNGQIVKGIAFLIAYAVSWALVAAVVGVLTTPILWIWGIVDAYRSAERINHEHAVSTPN